MKYWTRHESKERFPKPITPLGWSLLQVPLEATLDRMSETFGIKKYANSEMILWHNYYIYTRKNFFNDLKNLKFNYIHIVKLFFLIFGSFLITIFKTSSEEGPFKGRFTNRVFYKLFGKETKALVLGWPTQIQHLRDIMGRRFNLNTSTEITYEIFYKIRVQMQEDSKVYFAEDFNVYFLKKIIFSLLQSQLKEAGMSANEAEKTLAFLSNNLKDNFSVKMIEDFNDQNISIDELKRKYGHLTDNWDLYSPTFGEQESIWSDRAFNIKLPPLIKNSATEAILKNISWNKNAVELIDWFQKLVLMDEDLRAYSSLQYPEARELMKQVEKTAAWKELVVPDDSIYFLHLNEIEFGLRNQNFHLYFDMIKQRRNAFMDALKTIPPFELIENDSGTFTSQSVPDQNAQVLEGISVSSGIVEGSVVHINEYIDLTKITKRSIIVVESATPVYAPFYALAGGIISEMGGQLSHGAIVAREFEIPMLTGVKNVCVILDEGQNILLDANIGIIKVIN